MNTEFNSAWESLYEQIRACTKCDLCKSRTQTVIGCGPRENFKFVIIGEAPGEDEDKQGIPFVGKSGQLLNKILERANIDRDTIYIMNVVKCRPEGNRTPSIKEIISCSDFREAQLLLLQPSIIVTMGNPATQSILGTAKGITGLRGNWVEWRGVQIMPTFHPSYLLRQNPDEYQRLANVVYRDFLAVKARLESTK